MSINYASNDYVDQYRHLILFYKKYVGEELNIPFISYTDKKKYTNQVLDLRYQIDLISRKKVQLLQEYRGGTNNARLFMLLIRHREITMISDGKEIVEIKII